MFVSTIEVELSASLLCLLRGVGPAELPGLRCDFHAGNQFARVADHHQLARLEASDNFNFVTGVNSDLHALLFDLILLVDDKDDRRRFVFHCISRQRENLTTGRERNRCPGI